MPQFPSLTLKIEEQFTSFSSGKRLIAISQALKVPQGKWQILIGDKFNRKISSLVVADQPVRMAFSPDDGLLVVSDTKGNLRGYDLVEDQISDRPNRAFNLKDVLATHVFGVSEDKTVIGIGIENSVQLYRVEADTSAVPMQNLHVGSQVLRIEFEPEGVRVLAKNHFTYFCVAKVG